MQIVPSGGHSTERLGVWTIVMKCADPQGVAWDMAGVSIGALVELGSGGTAGPDRPPWEWDPGVMVEQVSWWCQGKVGVGRYLIAQLITL